jgi:DNA-binding SARP family transcriptional activator
VTPALTACQEKRDESVNLVGTLPFGPREEPTVPDRTSLPLTLRLFGPFEALVNGEPLPRLHSRKGPWLLALLALRSGAAVDRTWLAATLWPDSFPPQAAVSLRGTLADLRRALGPEAARIRAPTARTLALDLEGAWVDAHRFDQFVAQGDEEGLQAAVALYAGPFLEGCGEEWVTTARQVREQTYLRALERLAARALERGECAAAEEYLRRIIAVDPLRESAHRGRMQALAAGEATRRRCSSIGSCAICCAGS